MHGPLAIIAEVTHRCPLHCVYCSNPLELQREQEEISADAWARVFHEAAEMGALQLHLTGGEPAARKDLIDLVAAGRTTGLYVNLITSGLGLNESRLDELANAGLDHIQLSFQDVTESPANELAGAKAHGFKISLAKAIRARKMAFTVNIVVHRENLDRIVEMIAMAEQLGADRLEIAHVQYYGWALENRERLLPTRVQVDRSLDVVEAARARLRGKMQIDCVVPDYYARFPKACMGGWGQKLILIDPAGRAMPCHAAGCIPGLRFDKVSEHGLRWIWEESESFQKFRGEDWMPEPCRSCDRRGIDFGGCRCQAMLLTGDGTRTDPVCELSPDHQTIQAAIEEANLVSLRSIRVGVMPPAVSSPPRLWLDWVYRRNP